MVDVVKSGAGFHTAWPTGSLGMGAGRSTFSTTLATRRKRSRMSDIATTTAGPASAVKTRRTGSSLPPMPSSAIVRRAFFDDSAGFTSSMWAPRISSLPGSRW